MKQRAIIALVDDLATRATIESAAGELGCALEFAPQRDDVIAYLADRQPALLLVDLRAAGWEPWVTRVKTSPATRKMPLVAVGPRTDAGLLQRALRAGADAALSDAAFETDAAGAIRAHIRADDGAELQRQSQLPLPELALRGVREFNAGEYFEQHETFEHVWRAEPGPVRALYQGMLQIGVAYYQIRRGNHEGARKIFLRARQHLAALPDVCQGVDVARLRDDAAAAMAELDRLGPARVAEFDRALFKPIALVGQSQSSQQS